MRTIQFFGAGSSFTGNNTSLTPDVYSSVAIGDLVCILAGIRTGLPRTPAGWTTLAQNGRVALMARVWQRGDTMPTVTFVGGAAGDDTMVRSFVMRNVPADITQVVHAAALQTNGSAQNVAVPAVTTTIDGCLLLNIIFKNDDYTDLSRSGYFFGLSLSSTIGNDASCGIMGKFQGTAGVEAAGTVTVTGGAAATSVAIALAIAPFETTYTLMPDTDRPCDFASDFTTGVDAACAAMTAIDANISAMKNPPAVSVSAADGATTSNSIVTFSSVDIDPTGVADLVADPNSVTIPSGRWFTGWYAQIKDVVPFNALMAGDGDNFSIQTAVFDLDAAFRYPPDENHGGGGGSMSAATMKQVSVGGTHQVSMQASFSGSFAPGSSSFEVSTYKAVQYLFRISD